MMEKATNIHVERARIKISQKELADAMDVTTNHICNLELGKSLPKIGLALRLAKYFNCEVSYLLKLKED